MKKTPEDPPTVAAVREWRKLPRAARRAAWRAANRSRGRLEVPDALLGGRVPRRAPRVDWQTLPLPTPLQRHVLSGRAHPQSQRTRAISLGFNRDQRRAMLAKKGPRRMLTPVWGSPGSPGGVKSRPTSTWSGTWNKWALRLEFNRRLRAHAEEYRRRNVWWRRALRFVRNPLKIVPFWWRYLTGPVRRLLK